MQPERAFDVVLIGLSARALVAGAHRAGLRALALDLFGDEDTRLLAARNIVLKHGSGFSIDADDLMDQLSRHVASGTPLVLASGFEHRPKLVERLAARFPLAGSGANTLRLLKQPERLAQLLSELGIAHPRLFAGAAPEGVRALAKRIGGAGGQHIRPARRVRGRQRYLQERLEGCAISVLFLGNGLEARMIGFSEQWCDPARHAPFRYGGAAGPVRLSARIEADIARALTRLTQAAGIYGLASADLIVNGEDWHLVEVNPRPGASLDVFDHPPLPPLLRLHLNACAGELPELALADISAWGQARAACLLYAPTALTVQNGPLPDYVADRPVPGARMGSGDPVCTVLAESSSPEAARQLAQQRARDLARLFAG